MTARFVALAMIATALIAGPAGAQRTPERGQAAALVRQGQAYFQRGDFDRALAEYQAAFDLSREPVLLFNIGLCHDRANRPEPALDAFRRYIQLAPEGVVADEARADIARLTPIVERIVADRQAHDERVRQEAAQAAAVRAEAARHEEAAAARRMRLSLYVMAAGAVIAGGGAAMHVVAQRTHDRAEAEPDPARFFEGRERVALERNIAWGAYAAGALTIATGLVLAYTARGRSDMPQLSAAIVPGGAAMVMTWSQ